MASRGLKAPRIPKRKHGGLCKDCPNENGLELVSKQVCCKALIRGPEPGRWRLIPHTKCEDRPKVGYPDTSTYIEAPRATMVD